MPSRVSKLIHPHCAQAVVISTTKRTPSHSKTCLCVPAHARTVSGCCAINARIDCCLLMDFFLFARTRTPHRMSSPRRRPASKSSCRPPAAKRPSTPRPQRSPSCATTATSTCICCSIHSIRHYHSSNRSIPCTERPPSSLQTQQRQRPVRSRALPPR